MRRGLIIATLVVLLAAGCTPSEDETTPTPSTVTSTTTPPPPPPSTTPAPSPTLSEEQVNTEAAKQTILDYTAALNEVGAEGFTTWPEKLSMYWGHPDVANPAGASLQASADAGQRTEGAVVVTTITVTEYVPDPTGDGHEQVRLEYCSDVSAVTTYSADGTVDQRESEPRFLTEVFMQHQSDGRWTINERNAQPDRTC